MLSKYDEFVEEKNIPRLEIVCMHHHLISIPDTGCTSVVGISHAGDALRACLESGVDVVICGHKHRPWMWNLGKLLIVYTGTACSSRYKGVFDDIYNIIDINNNKVHDDIKMVVGKKIPLPDIVKKFKQEIRTQELPT